MANENPYQVLGLNPDSTVNEIEDAFSLATAPYNVSRKLSKSEHKTLQRFHDAYAILTSPVERSALDRQMSVSSMQGQVDVPVQEVSTRDDAPPEVRPPSKVKNLGQKPQTTSPFKTMFLVFASFFGLMFLVNIFAPKSDTTKTDTAPPVAKPYVATPIPLMADGDSPISNNIKYPNQAIFSQPIIYSPDGTLMPQQAGLMPNLPALSDGRHNLMIKNVRPEAVFGKVLFRPVDSTSTTVIRYFYIPMHETLTLFRLPAGSFQVQILTLVKPTAYVSPQFSFSVSDENSNTIVTNWDYPYPASQLF